MNLKQIEYFIAIAELKNITAASRQLHIAQPPLSRQIAMLEEELNTELLRRGNRGVELTDAGRIFYMQARQVMQSVTELQEMMRENNSGVRGELRIGSLFSTLPVFSRQLRFLNENYPLIKVRIKHGAPRELMDDLASGASDLLFLRSPAYDTQDFKYHILEEDHLVLATHRDLDPAPDREEVEVEQLRGLPLCMLYSGDYWGYNDYLVSECEKRGFSPNIICECDDTAVALLLVMEKIGISYQPEQSVRSLHNPYLRIKKVKDCHVSVSPAVLWNSNAYLSRSAQLFLSLFNGAVDHPLAGEQ